MAFLFEEFICDSKVNANRLIIGLICVVVGTLSKRIYIPLLAIVFLYNSNKFKSKTKSSFQYNYFNNNISSNVYICCTYFGQCNKWNSNSR